MTNEELIEREIAQLAKDAGRGWMGRGPQALLDHIDTLRTENAALRRDLGEAVRVIDMRHQHRAGCICEGCRIRDAIRARWGLE